MLDDIELTQYDIIMHMLYKNYTISLNSIKGNSTNNLYKIRVQYKDDIFTMVSNSFYVEIPFNYDDNALKHALNKMSPNNFMNFYREYKKILNELVRDVEEYKSLFKKRYVEFDKNKLIII